MAMGAPAFTGHAALCCPDFPPLAERQVGWSVAKLQRKQQPRGFDLPCLIFLTKVGTAPGQPTKAS